MRASASVTDMTCNRHPLLAFASFLLLQGPAVQHELSTAETARVLVQDLHLLSGHLRTAERDRKRYETLYELGLRSAELASALSDEVAAHGYESNSVAEASIIDAAELGVVIHWSAQHERFYYDGAAFREYLAQLPDGPRAANSWFRVIETDFYFYEPSDQKTFEAAAAEKRRFLDAYADYEHAGTVGMFLSIDYRDMWRLCRTTDRQVCANEYLDRAREELASLIENNRDTSIGEMATRLLARLEQELVTDRILP